MNDDTSSDINSLASDISDLKNNLKFLLKDIIDSLPIDVTEKLSLLSSLRNL